MFLFHRSTCRKPQMQIVLRKITVSITSLVGEKRKKKKSDVIPKCRKLKIPMGPPAVGTAAQSQGRMGLGSWAQRSTRWHPKHVCPKGKLRQGCWEGELLLQGRETLLSALSPSSPALPALLGPRVDDRASPGCWGCTGTCQQSWIVFSLPVHPTEQQLLSAMVWVCAGAWPRYRNGIYGIKWNSIWDKKWGGLYSRVVLNWGLMYVQYTNIFDRPLTPIIL